MTKSFPPFLVGLLAVVPLLLGLGFPAYGEIPPRPSDERIITNERGEKSVLIPWSIGSLDHVVTLRMPFGHTSLWSMAVGAWLGPNYGRDKANERPSARNFSFAALLPDMAARTKENYADFKRPGGGDKVEGLVDSALRKDNPRTARDFLLIWLRIQRERLIEVTTGHPHPMVVVDKPDRFGLRRIGPRPVMKVAGASTHLSDLYFEGESPEASPFFIVCDAEEVPTRDEDPSLRIVGQCEHSLILAPLSAVVKFGYRRVFLKDWREIQRKVETLLTSFLPSGE